MSKATAILITSVLSSACANAQCPVWSELGQPSVGSVYALGKLANGDLVIGGQFTEVGGVAASRIARWDGTNFFALGQGVTGPTAPAVYSIAPAGGASLVAGGRFTNAGGTAANYVAKWDGDAWSPLGAGVQDYVNAVVVLPTGDVVVGGLNFVSRWNGTTWTMMGTLGGETMALAVLPNGDLIAGGRYTGISPAANKAVARWTGTGWAPLGLGLSDPSGRSLALSLAVLSTGDIVAGGSFSQSGTSSMKDIAKWSAASGVWSAMGSGPAGISFVHSLAALPGGGVVAGGSFATFDGLGVNHLAMMDSAAGQWHALGEGIGPAGPDADVNALLALPNGIVLVGGQFSSAGGVSTPFGLAACSLGTSPMFSADPRSAVACPSGSASFFSTATGSEPLNIHWELLVSGVWHPLGNDPAALPCGPALAFATPVNSFNVTISVGPCPGNSTSPQRFQVRCVASNACGIAMSNEATYTVCPADFSCSGSVTVNDIFEFLAAWFVGAPGADFNQSGAANIQDIFDYLAAWFVGC